MNEDQLIPYKASPLPGGPWLVFAPHPDDETFGMGGSLLLAKAQGIDVDLVVMTDGGEGSDAAIDNLVEIREAETLEACQQLGIRECQFWRQPDRQLKGSEALARNIIQLISEKKPAHIFIPSFLEYHPDHRATSEIVWDAAASIETPDFALVSYDITSLGPCNLLIDTSSVKEAKQAIMGVYHSQISNHRYVQIVQGIDIARTFSLGSQVSAAEGFFVYPNALGMSFFEASTHWFNRFAQKIVADSPLVSVIVRTKDRPANLRKALSSLTLQTHPNLEVVVVNDGGAPCGGVVDSFQNQFTHLTLIENKENLGRAHAANIGLDHIQGAYFLFLDDDDWFDPQHVSNLLAAFSELPESLVVYTGVRAVDEAGETIRVFDDAFDRNRLFYENYIPIHAVMMRTSIRDRGLRFDPSLDVFEDWDFWLQLCQITIRFSHVDGVSANYLIGKDQGIGVGGGYHDTRRRLYARWAKTWGVDEIDDLLTRLVVLNKNA